MLLYHVKSTPKKNKHPILQQKKTTILKKNFPQIFWKDKKWPLKGFGKKIRKIVLNPLVFISISVANIYASSHLGCKKWE